MSLKSLVPSDQAIVATGAGPLNPPFLNAPSGYILGDFEVAARKSPRIGGLGGGLVASLLLLWASPGLAQIIPDQNWGTESSRLNGNLIESGALRGSNLFHSFQQFNINAGQQVFFANPAGVQNIFARVTGGVSSIQGKLGVTGLANLFLLNPAGVLFGPQAQLDVPGAFVTSTASVVRFGSGEFRIDQAGAPGLLTIQPSALVLSSQSGEINIQANQIYGRDVLLVGNTTFSGGTLYADRVQIGGADQQPVGLAFDNNRISATFSENAGVLKLDNKSTIQIQQGEIRLNVDRLEIDNSQIGGAYGNIAIAANQVSLSQTGRIVTGTFTTQDGGNIDLKVRDRLTIDSGAKILSTTESPGKTGNITIAAPQLELSNRGEISHFSTNGGTGRIDIQSQDIRMNQDAVIISAIYGNGAGGDIQIKGDRLSLANGSIIQNNTASTDLNAPGGSIRIDVGDVDLFGVGNQFAYEKDGLRLRQPSALGSGTGVVFSDGRAVGAAPGGDLILNVDRLSIRDRGLVAAGGALGTSGRGGKLVINARESVEVIGTKDSPDSLNNGLSIIRTEAFGNGDAGELVITAPRVVIRDTGLVSSRAFYDSTGRGGNLTINAEELTVGGKAIGGLYPSSILSKSSGSGDAGNLTINAKRLQVDRGQIEASTDNTGLAGSIFLNSSFVKLNGGEILAVSNAQDGGNIAFTGSEILLLRNNASIATRAGVNQLGRGSGGKISIDSNFLVAIPRENSFISANAYGGRGGQVKIMAQSILGIEPLSRSQLERALNTTDLSQVNLSLLPSSITTISQLSPDLSGELAVQIFTPDPSQGATQLPVDIVDPASQVAQVCPSASSKVQLGSLTQSGRGSLPPSPLETVGAHVIAPLAIWRPEKAPKPPILGAMNWDRGSVLPRLNMASCPIQPLVGARIPRPQSRN
jgi:filamentous hemagglutinin family protein